MRLKEWKADSSFVSWRGLQSRLNSGKRTKLSVASLRALTSVKSGSPLPCFFVSVAAKGFSYFVSSLESTLAVCSVNTDSKGLDNAKRLSVLFALNARGINNWGQKHPTKAKTPIRRLAFRVRTTRLPTRNYTRMIVDCKEKNGGTLVAAGGPLQLLCHQHIPN